jgi:ATP-binding cassette subfamily B (MDR/TAP) protein 1
MASLPEVEKRRLVTAACQAAFAHDFIEDLPQGYDTIIGERGASLSGGQKQRIVIARSIISNPKVLLLDEATSALDPNAEKIVQQALNNVANGRTMIIIAHRLSTIRDADNIVVMSKGETIENGTHDELIAHNGAYASLVRAQDLGHGSIEANDGEDKEHGEFQDLDNHIANVAGIAPADDDEGYSLPTGLWYVLKEQPELWMPLAVTFICGAAGGTSISFTTTSRVLY